MWVHLRKRKVRSCFVSCVRELTRLSQVHRPHAEPDVLFNARISRPYQRYDDPPSRIVRVSDDELESLGK